MPGPMLHLSVAKKVNPNASIAFYVGTLTPDGIKDRLIKDKAHLYGIPDREEAMKRFALKADNEFLKGMLLHLFVDGKWQETHLSSFIEKEGEGWFSKYYEENFKMTSFAFHNTDWAYNLLRQIENWDFNGFTETEFVTKDNVKWVSSELLVNNKLEASAVFTPALIEKFANDIADDFAKWCSCIL